MRAAAVADEHDLDLGPRESYEFYLPVVKEYAEKLATLCARAFQLSQARGRRETSSDFATLESAQLLDQYECLRPYVEKLVHRVATLLDHARVGPDLELLLTLRQEELESALRLAPAVFAELEKESGTKKVRAIIARSRVTPLRP